MLSLAHAADPAPLSPPVKIRINTAGLTSEAAIFLAYDKGYFKSEGLQVELVTAAAANSSSDTLTQLVGSELDLATFSLSAGLLNAINRGLGVTGLMPLNAAVRGDRSSGLIVRQDLLDSGKYKGPADLKGMKIAVLTLGGNAHYNVLKALQSGGLKESDVQLVTMPFPDAVVALANKAIDAAFNVEPFIGATKARGAGTMVLAHGDTSPGVPTIVLYANTTFATKQREAVQRFVTAVIRGSRDYLAATTKGVGHDELIKSYQTHTRIKEAERLRSLNVPNADPNGRVDYAALDGLQQFFIAAGVMQKPVDNARIFDPSFVDYALTRLGRAN